MRFVQRHFLSIFLIFITTATSAQTVGNLRISKDYRGNMDDILEMMSKDMSIRFVYDKNHMSRYKGSINSQEERTINGMLNMFKSVWEMEYHLSEDGYIFIGKDKERLDSLIKSKSIEKVEVKVAEKKSKEKLTPVKRNFTLAGDIIDKTNGERIPYASVHIAGTTHGVSTDPNGNFTIEKVPADTSTIVITYLGYQTQRINLKPSKENTRLYVEMEPQTQDIAAVFIVGRKDDKALQQYTGEHKMKMSPMALKVLPNVGEKDIMRGFQLMPGVSASNENSSGMYVRGGTPDQNLILYDGFTVYYVDHLHGFYSAFNSNAIKDVQLYKGGFESKYGGRLSSVTEITAKDGNSKKATLGGEISLLSMNVYAEVPIGKKITSLVAFRRSYQGYLYNKISSQYTEGDSEDAVPRPQGMGSSQPTSYFYDLNGKITYNPTKKDIVSLSIFNGTDYLDNTPQFKFPKNMPAPPDGSSDDRSITMDNSDYSRYGNIGGSIRWARKNNEKLTSNYLMSYSNFYSTRDQTRSITIKEDGVSEKIKNGILEENSLVDFSMKSDWKYSLNEKNLLEFGASGTYYDINYNYSQNDTSSILNKANKAFLGGLYFQDKIKFLNNNLVVTPGLRASYYSLSNKIYIEPRLGISYLLNSNLTLNAATGLYYQYANRVIREDVMSGNADFWILSDNADIPVSSSKHLNIGLNYDLPNYIFSVEGYYKLNQKISEYTLRFQRSQFPNGSAQVSEQFFTGDGYSTGLEFLAQKKSGNLSGWISYTLAQVKNRFPEQSSKYYFAYQDVTHELKSVLIYKFGNFDFSATWIFSTGRPYTAPLGAYTITQADGIKETFYAVSDKNTFRLPDYHRLDLAATFRFNLFGSVGRQNAVSVSLFNAYNRKNVSSKQFQLVGNTILESNINYLSITPNVSLIFKF